MSKPPQESDQANRPIHRPVLLREVIEFLDLHPGQTVVDGTVGAAGHSQQILKGVGPTGTLIGLDRDPMMLRLAAGVVTEPNCHLRHASYLQIPELLVEFKVAQIDAVLLDLGLSSDQLADSERGFGFDAGGPLDLRFDPTTGRPAWELVNTLREDELARILCDYGEEMFSGPIARELVSRRVTRPVQTAEDLVDAVRESVPRTFQQRARRHPATRVFQALRIYVNNELDQLQSALDDSLYRSLKAGGRVVVISFHSLEDKLIKDAFRDQQRWENLTRRPVAASAVEKKVNPRARSAKLRAAKKL
jgi:16S rRNA (cytosine1402-N4)-methyltransferase